MPGFVVLLAWVKDAGGGLLAQKMLGVVFGGDRRRGRCSRSRSSCSTTVERRRPPAGRRAAGGVSARVHTRAATALLSRAVAGGPRDVERRRDRHAGGRAAGAGARAAGDAGRRAGPGRRAGVRRGDGAVRLGARGGAAAVGAGVRLLAGARGRSSFARRLLTAVGVAATLVVLLPWGIRHVRQSGSLYFTDDHGGITALIGANPNSEGTYTRALNRMFKDVTGRSVLDEPHHDTDRAAYAIAREWFRFEPALRARPRDAEGRSPVRSRASPALLVDLPARRAGRSSRGLVRRAPRRDHAASRTASALAVAGLALAGVAAAVARRRWALLALVPFQLALVATYTTLLRRAALPAADRAARVPVRGVRARRRSRPPCAPACVVRAPASSTRRRRSVPALVLVVVWRVGLAGDARRRHRPARAPSLGGQRGGARRAPAPAALGAGAAARPPVAAGRIAGRRARARRRRRASDAAPPAPGRRAAAGRPLRDRISGWRPAPARRRASPSRAGGRGRGRRARDARRRNRPPGRAARRYPPQLLRFDAGGSVWIGAATVATLP